MCLVHSCSFLCAHNNSFVCPIIFSSIAVNVGIGIMQKDLKKTKISKSGKYQKFSFDVRK